MSSCAARTARMASSSCETGWPNTASSWRPSARTLAPCRWRIGVAMANASSAAEVEASGSKRDPSARVWVSTTTSTLTILRVGSSAAVSGWAARVASAVERSGISIGSCARIAASSSTSRGPGSIPRSWVSSARARRPSSSASACRPSRYRAVISAARSRSRNGCSSTSARSSDTATGSPIARSASMRSSSVSSRASSSRSMSCLRELVVGEVGEGRAAPQRERLAERRGGFGRLVRGHGRAAALPKALEALDIERLVGDLEDVARGGSHDLDPSASARSLRSSET